MISLILPTLGTRKFEIERLIASLNNQERKDFELVIVSQGNHSLVKELLEKADFKYKHIITDEVGLSKARNLGLKNSKGEIIMLSDDDCWYPSNAILKIIEKFENNNYSIDVVLTQIYDPEKKCYYKKYSPYEKIIKSKIEVMSISSIEIAFNKKSIIHEFDTDFGLGGLYPAAEEVDFLLSNYSSNLNKIKYYPEISVYHKSREGFYSHSNIAKGRIYKKHFGVIGLLIPFRDLFLKKQNTFKDFYRGYFTKES